MVSDAMPIPEFAAQRDHADQEFSALDLKGRDLSHFSFEGCTFTKCSFAGANLNHALIAECRFLDCDLSNLELLGARFRDSEFQNCKLIGLNWTAAGTASALRFRECAINYGIFDGLDLRGFQFQDCAVREAEFSGANLSGVVFSGSDLKGARFGSADLTKADLRRAKNYTIRPTETKLKKARFSLPEATLLLYGLDIELEE